MKQSTELKQNKSLKRLREILGYSQERFASLVGVSLDLIKSVETGRLPLTHKLGRKIHIATGARIESFSLAEKRAKWTPITDGTIYPWIPGELSKSDYTRDMFERYQQNLAGAGSVDTVMKEFMPVLRDLFCAAAKRGSPKGRFPVVRASLWDWIYEADHAFNLKVKLPE